MDPVEVLLLLLAALRPALAADFSAATAAAATTTTDDDELEPDRPQQEDLVPTTLSTSEFVRGMVRQATVGNETEVCYERLGCFETESPWWSLLRPLPAPEDPETVGTRFYLFTRTQRDRTHIPIVPEISLDDLDFSATRPTYFITHGFISNSNSSWMHEMKDALLEKFDANVILTDWGPGASGALKYMNAASNTRVVAAEAARLIRYLVKENQVDVKNIHLIGHSLGAQISAYIGKAIKNIGKITALDPAQPGFEGYDAQVRLDVSDAAFVEVVHTHARPTIPTFGLGMIAQYGDVDYYINGGFTQPGCSVPTSIPPIKSLTDIFKLSMSVIANIVSCPHGRAPEVYIEAIRLNNCTFWGHPGNTIENVVGAVSRGRLQRYLSPSPEDCSVENCSPLKLFNEFFPARGPFFVPTTSQRPYCISEPEVDGRMVKGMKGVIRGISRGVIGALGGIAKNLPTFG